jgi:signal transduction histidine kinase
VFLVFTEDQKHWRIPSLLSYIASFVAFYLCTRFGILTYVYQIPAAYVPLGYIYHLLVSFILCYLLAHFFIKLDKIRLQEVDNAHSMQLKLESEVLMKELIASKAQNQVLKLQDEYKQLDLFNYIVSHNLRGPLNRIKGLSKLLQIGNELDRKEVLLHMADSVVKLEEMVSDLNNVLANRKKGQEAKTLVRFQEVIEIVKHNLEEEINTSNAEISVKDDVLEINSIKSIWLSVLQNLISNAVKYSKSDVNPKIEIVCKYADEFIEVSVQDNGLGFDLDAYKDQVFQLYNRFHTDLPGKGMGLYLVRNHVTMLDGTIELFSKPNKGSLFVIKIPRELA